MKALARGIDASERKNQLKRKLSVGRTNVRGNYLYNFTAHAYLKLFITREQNFVLQIYEIEFKKRLVSASHILLLESMHCARRHDGHRLTD